MGGNKVVEQLPKDQKKVGFKIICPRNQIDDYSHSIHDAFLNLTGYHSYKTDTLAIQCIKAQLIDYFNELKKVENTEVEITEDDSDHVTFKILW